MLPCFGTLAVCSVVIERALSCATFDLLDSLSVAPSVESRVECTQMSVA
jgi:hypothetical protein